VDSWFDCLYAGLLGCGHIVHIIPDRSYLHVESPNSKFEYSFPANDYSLDSIQQNIVESFYDFLVIGSIYPELEDGKYIDIIEKFKNVIVVYQAHDYPESYDYKKIINKPFIEFRKEIPIGLESQYYGMVHPNREKYLIKIFPDKFLDICGILGAKCYLDGALSPTETKRRFVCELLQKDFQNSLVLSNMCVDFNSFAKLTSFAWIGLNLKGLGEQNSRYYEIPSFQSFLLTENVNSVIPNDFIENVHKVSFFIPEDYKETLEWYKELKDTIKNLLSNKNELKEKIIASFEYTKIFHSLEYNTNRFLEIINDPEHKGR
jgi:hypothetical protein